MNLRDTLDYLARLVQQDADRTKAEAHGESPEQLLAAAEKRAAELSRLHQKACRALDLMQHDRDAHRERAENFEGRAKAMEASRDHEAAAREQAQQDAKDAKERARVATVAALNLRRQTPDAAQRTLDTIRDASTALEAWVTLGMYYGLTPEQAGQGARAWRTAAETIAERHAQRAENDVKEIAERLATSEKRADDADRHAQTAEATTRELATRLDAAEKRAQDEACHSALCRISRDGWRHRAMTRQAAIDRVRALHTPVDHNGRAICTDCSGYADGSTDSGAAPYPCSTLALLDD
ncbi:hypothetical protein [Streptomyces halstedii]|uniref:Uncharacterized protein n=1 Tax=Streptomyces halstedii TaxID=1944 RepID=A0A6N9UCE7_STRHA|nr:hypothetical protein [Streptomyces halstedii]NEA19833.1 hypothetical protein [Streptomyces halstedii]